MTPIMRGTYAPSGTFFSAAPQNNAGHLVSRATGPDNNVHTIEETKEREEAQRN